MNSDAAAPEPEEPGRHAGRSEAAGEARTVALAPPSKRAPSSVLVAAMMGFAEALGWDHAVEETAEVASSAGDGDDLQLDYGRLDPID